MGKINQVNLEFRVRSNSKNISNSGVWYALQTFYQKETELEKLLTERQMKCFVPMRAYESENFGQLQIRWKPVVHNLLFLEKTDTESAIVNRLRNISIPFRFYRNRETNKIYEIPDRSILELRAACNPSYKGNLYMDAEQAQARPGYSVMVTRGPFAGLMGTLTQYKKR